MNRSRFITCFAAVLCCCAAGLSLADSSGSPGPLLPLAVGNTWTYAAVDGSGERHIARVTESREVDGIRWYLYQEFDHHYWVRNNEDGAHYLAVDGVDHGPPFEELVLAPAGAGPGEHDFDGLDVEHWPCEEPLVVPAGTFDCHVYRFSLGEDFYTTSYFAEGVGLIYNESGPGTEVPAVELVEYTVH